MSLILALLLAANLHACGPTVGFAVNNPGNIAGATLSKWPGSTGHDAWGHLVFEDKIHGVRAIRHNLVRYWTRHRINTVHGIVHRWVSIADTTKAARDDYEKAICQAVGRGPGEALDMTDRDTLEELAQGIVYAENGCDDVPEYVYDAVFQLEVLK